MYLDIKCHNRIYVRISDRSNLKIFLELTIYTNRFGSGQVDIFLFVVIITYHSRKVSTFHIT